MSSDERIVLIYATAPSLAVAERIAGALLDSKLIACANLWPGMRAMYVWNGVRQIDDEVVMIFKTRESLAERVIAEGRALHPYDTPAFVVLKASGGHPPFLDWVRHNTAAEQGS